MRYDHVLFDLDGTLVDSEEGITRSVEYALAKYGITVCDRKELRGFIGPPLVESFMRFYGFSEEKAGEATDFYRERYAVLGVHENRLYPGIRELLTELKAGGAKLSVATSKPEIFAEIVIKDMGLGELFDFIAGTQLDDAAGRKNNYRTQKEDVIAYAVKELGVIDRSRVLMVGDRKHDVIGAKINGMDSAYVLWGFGSRAEAEEHGADYTVEKPGELIDIVS